MLHPLSWPSSWFHKEEPILVTELNLKIDILYASDADSKKILCMSHICLLQVTWKSSTPESNAKWHCFNMGKYWDTKYLGNCWSLWYQKWRKQSTKWIQEDFWVPKVKIPLWPFLQDHSFEQYQASSSAERNVSVFWMVLWHDQDGLHALIWLKTWSMIQDDHIYQKGKTLVRLCECVGCPC